MRKTTGGRTRLFVGTVAPWFEPEANTPGRALFHAAGGESDAQSPHIASSCPQRVQQEGYPFENVILPFFTETRIVSPAAKLPARISRASGFSISCWIARLSGRAP